MLPSGILGKVDGTCVVMWQSYPICIFCSSECIKSPLMHRQTIQSEPYIPMFFSAFVGGQRQTKGGHTSCCTFGRPLGQLHWACLLLRDPLKRWLPFRLPKRGTPKKQTDPLSKGKASFCRHTGQPVNSVAPWAYSPNWMPY